MQTTAPVTVSQRVLINLDRCIECQSCAAACYYTHANAPAVGFARAGAALLPLICRQCKAASCVEACPADAMVRDEAGVVYRRLFRCTGCGSCSSACPFGVLSSRMAGVPSGFRSADRLNGRQVGKCDLCVDRVEDTDDPGVPRCVAACPSGALQFSDEHHPEEVKLSVLGGRTTGEHPFKRR